PGRRPHGGVCAQRPRRSKGVQCTLGQDPGDPRITIRTVLAGGRVVGNVAAFVDDVFGKQEVTYWIGKEFWGQGIATRALSRFLTEVTKRPIYGRVAKDNVAWIRVVGQAGWRVTGDEGGQ